MSSHYFYYIALVFCIGFIVIIYGLYLLIKSIDTNKWSETKGVILTSEVDKISTPAGMDGSSLSYQALIEYTYQVENQEYNSKRIFYGSDIGKPLPFKSKSLIKRYPQNSEVIVYYNPSVPKESVLQKGIKFIVFEILVLGCLFLLLGFVLIEYEVAIKSFFNHLA